MGGRRSARSAARRPRPPRRRRGAGWRRRFPRCTAPRRADRSTGRRRARRTRPSARRRSRSPRSRAGARAPARVGSSATPAPAPRGGRRSGPAPRPSPRPGRCCGWRRPPGRTVLGACLRGDRAPLEAVALEGCGVDLHAQPRGVGKAEQVAAQLAFDRGDRVGEQELGREAVGEGSQGAAGRGSPGSRGRRRRSRPGRRGRSTGRPEAVPRSSGPAPCHPPWRASRSPAGRRPARSRARHRPGPRRSRRRRSGPRSGFGRRQSLEVRGGLLGELDPLSLHRGQPQHRLLR